MPGLYPPGNLRARRESRCCIPRFGSLMRCLHTDESRNQLALTFVVLFSHLDERQRHLLTGAEARILGHGGIRAVAQAAEVSETTVRKGVDELEAGAEPLGRNLWDGSAVPVAGKGGQPR